MPLYLSSNNSKAVGAAQFQPSPLAREFLGTSIANKIHSSSINVLF